MANKTRYVIWYPETSVWTDRVWGSASAIYGLDGDTPCATAGPGAQCSAVTIRNANARQLPAYWRQDSVDEGRVSTATHAGAKSHHGRIGVEEGP